jgi:hypothetical protein
MGWLAGDTSVAMAMWVESKQVKAIMDSGRVFH